MMKHVQFYILSQSNLEQLALDLATSQWRSGKRVLLYCQSEQQAFALDELLWARNADEFVPHNLAGESTPVPTPIEISWGDKRNAQRRDVLINLHSLVPEFQASFNQIIDFVPPTEAEKVQARERYKQYRQLGWQLSTQNV